MERKHWTVSENGIYTCPICNSWYSRDELAEDESCPNCGFCEKKQVTPKIKGAKYDDDKPRPSTVPIEAIEAIMATREYGLAKYAEAEDWRRIKPERWHEALLRHVLAIWEDPTHIDEESGLPSLYHVMTNGAFLCACLKDILEERARE